MLLEIKPITGKIESQPLNDNFSVLDSKIEQKADKEQVNNLSNEVNNKIPRNILIDLKPTLTIIDDDTRAELYSLIFPVLQQRNIKITSALISSRIDNRDPSHTITYAQFLEMKESGLVEFVNHTHEHVRLNELTEEEIDYQIRACQEWLQNEGIYTRHLVYPFGAYNDLVIKVASKYVDSATIYGGSFFNPKSEVLDNYLVRRAQFEKPINTLKSYMDGAVANNGWVIINTHSQYETFDVNKLNEIFDYAETNGIEIKTYTEAYEKFRNIIEVRDEANPLFVIGAGGVSNIVESAITPNGSYIRYSDGTQICVKEVGINMTNGSVFTSNFPKPFKAGTIIHQWFSPGRSDMVPSAAHVHSLYGGGGLNSALRPSNVEGAYPNAWRFNRTEDPNAPTDTPVTLYALGRWK